MGILKVLVEAERCAVRGYTHICNLTAGKDHRTYDLALAILNEEIEHESWFSEFLGELPHLPEELGDERGGLPPAHEVARGALPQELRDPGFVFDLLVEDRQC